MVQYTRGGGGRGSGVTLPLASQNPGLDDLCVTSCRPGSGARTDSERRRHWWRRGPHGRNQSLSSTMTSVSGL